MNNIKNITDLSVKYVDSGIGIIEGTNDWYYVEENEDGGHVLYEAAEMYEETGECPGTCCHLIHYPDGIAHNPFKCSKNVYISNPIWDNGLYFLAVEFENERILIYHYNEIDRLLDIVMEMDYKDNHYYNLALTASPISLYNFSRNDGFKMIWPQKKEYEISDDEYFDFRNGDDLYFNVTCEDENDIEHEFVIVRDIHTGEIKKTYEGWASRMPDGSVWIWKA